MSTGNPYAPARSRLDDIELTEIRPRPWSLFVQSVLQAAFAMGLAIQAPAMMRKFASLFASLGARVPAGTRFLLDNPGLWWGFAVGGSVIAVWLLKRPYVAYREQRLMKIAVRGLAALLGLAVMLTVASLYLPILRSGAA